MGAQSSVVFELYVTIYQLLNGRCCVLCTGPAGYTPIHVAVINKDGKSVNIMLEQGAEVDEKVRHANSIAFFACWLVLRKT